MLGSRRWGEDKIMSPVPYDWPQTSAFPTLSFSDSGPPTLLLFTIFVALATAFPFLLGWPAPAGSSEAGSHFETTSLEVYIMHHYLILSFAEHDKLQSPYVVQCNHESCGPVDRSWSSPQRSGLDCKCCREKIKWNEAHVKTVYNIYKYHITSLIYLFSMTRRILSTCKESHTGFGRLRRSKIPFCTFLHEGNMMSGSTCIQ